MIRIDALSPKFAAIHHTVDDISNFSLRIRLIDESSPDEEDIAVFKWQQKRFSPNERERYKNLEDCLTDLEKEYHHKIVKETKKQRVASSKIFSYVEQDAHIPEDCNDSLRSRKHPAKPDLNDQNELHRLINTLSITTDKESDPDNENDDKPSKIDNEEYEYFDFLTKNYNNLISNDLLAIKDNDLQFFIMADFGEYYNSTWIPAEYILCTITYNKKTKLLQISPDFTTFEGCRIKITSDETKTYCYHIENASLFKKPEELNKEIRVLNQVNSSFKSNIVPQRTNLNLSSCVHVLLDINSGWGFENNNIFVRYWLVGNDWQLKSQDQYDQSKGVTIASKCVNSNRLHFNLSIEWLFTGCKVDYVKKDPVVFFELISKDTWSRFRTEGLTQLALPIALPGRRVYQLQCNRITSPGVVNELRRFFIGDCSNYQVMEPLTVGLNRMAKNTISSGVLEVALNVLLVQQNNTELANSIERSEILREMKLREKLRDPQLIKTVDDAVEAFKKASNALMEARDAAVGAVPSCPK